MPRDPAGPSNDSAVRVLGDETLRTIACELVKTVRNNVTIDWTMREKVQANIGRLVTPHPEPSRLPTRQAGEGHRTAIERVEALSAFWAAPA